MQLKGRQQSTKKWQQRCSKYYFKCNILNITQLRQKEQGAAVCDRDNSGNGVVSQQRQAGGQAMVAEAEAATRHTTINQKAVATAAAAITWQHGSGDNSANMAPAVQRGWPMWTEVIFCIVLTIICMPVRTDVITNVRRMAKHKSVLILDSCHPPLINRLTIN
jgi:hypothetical protein